MSATRDEAWYLDRIQYLVSLINDAFCGLAKAGDRLPGGTSLVEDILRVMARITAERELAGPSSRAVDDPLAAVRFYIARNVDRGLIDADAASAEMTPEGRLRVSWRESACPYRAHCSALASHGLHCVCPQRLYVEQSVSALLGRGMGSIVARKASREDDSCVFEMFPVSTEMLRPIDRVRKILSHVLQERDFAKDALSRLEAQYKLILETIDDAIVVVANDGNVGYVNPRACGVFGIAMEDAVGKPFTKGGTFGRLGDLCIDAAKAFDSWEGVTTIENAEGDKTHNIYLTRFSRVVGSDGRRIGTLIVLEDVTREELLKRELAAQTQTLENLVAEKTRELQDANTRLEVLASTDVLTGLPNRRTFEEMLRVELRRAARYRNSTSVLMIDVDEFKLVNDRYGHQVGDEILKHVAAILSKSVRSSDIVARWGGDEFAILLPRAGTAECEAVARRISENLLIENVSGDRTPGIALGLSAGWATETKADAEGILARADKMMYDHKAAKKARKQSNAAGQT